MEINAVGFKQLLYPIVSFTMFIHLKLELLGVSQKEIDNIKKTKKVNKYTTIYSPYTAILFTKNIQEGSAFKPKQVLFKLKNLDTVWVEVSLFQDQIHSLKNIVSYLTM